MMSNRLRALGCIVRTYSQTLQEWTSIHVFLCDARYQPELELRQSNLVGGQPGHHLIFIPSWVESGCGFISIGIGAFLLIEALVYMPRIDVCLPVLVCFDRCPFPIRFSSLVCVCTKMTSNRLRLLRCVVRTYSQTLQEWTSIHVFLCDARYQPELELRQSNLVGGQPGHLLTFIPSWVVGQRVGVVSLKPWFTCQELMFVYLFWYLWTGVSS